MEHPSNDHEDPPISTRIAISHAMKQGIHFEIIGKTMETETTTRSEFTNAGKSIVEQRKKSKREGLCESHSRIRVGKLTIGGRLR